MMNQLIEGLRLVLDKELNLSEVAVTLALLETGNMTVAQLSENLKKSPTTVNSTCIRLRLKGVIAIDGTTANGSNVYSIKQV